MLVFTVSMCSCGRDQQEEESTQTLKFKVDRSLLSSMVEDSVLSISFSAPKGWRELSKEVLMKAQLTAREQRIGIEGSEVSDTPEIKYAWTDTLSGGVVTVSQFPGFDTSDSSRTLREYKNFYQMRMPVVDVKTTVFFSNGFKVHQLLVSDSERVLFKMIFSSNRLPRPVQFDFSVPISAYSQLIRTIESVAGSVAFE